MALAHAGAAAPWSAICGICGMERSWGTADRALVKARAFARGWRWTNDFGLCCPTCALGSPGLYVLEENERIARNARRSQLLEDGGRTRSTPQPPENAEISAHLRPGVRGFGWNSLGELLEGLGFEPQDSGEPPEE